MGARTITIVQLPRMLLETRSGIGTRPWRMVTTSARSMLASMARKGRMPTACAAATPHKRAPCEMQPVLLRTITNVSAIVTSKAMLKKKAPMAPNRARGIRSAAATRQRPPFGGRVAMAPRGEMSEQLTPGATVQPIYRSSDRRMHSLLGVSGAASPLPSVQLIRPSITMAFSLNHSRHGSSYALRSALDA